MDEQKSDSFNSAVAESGGAQGHTPGPYVVCDVGDYGDYDGRCTVILSCDSNGDVDMRIAVVLGDDDESKATAKLLGAAPELLDALQHLFNSYKTLADSGDAGNWRLEDQPEGIKALAVLAKATGAPHD